MQETEINPNVDHNLLSFLGFSIEVETSSENSRAAIYVSSKVDYIRRGDLEGTDSNLIIINLKILWNNFLIKKNINVPICRCIGNLKKTYISDQRTPMGIQTSAATV